MKIAIVGDLQYSDGENLDSVAEDIASIGPDCTVIVGDYAYGSKFGSFEAFNTVASAFNSAGIKNLIPLLGNHDVQLEAEGKLSGGTVAENYKRAFGFYPENAFLEFKKFRVICVNTDIPRPEDFLYRYECYISPEKHSQICGYMEKNKDKPAVMITHAPVIGCGLHTVPLVHVRASNAYLYQDHNPYLWADFAEKYRQIRLWFSGHYHIGHSYTGSISQKDGLTYFSVGAPVSCTRDGQKHTRLLEEKDGILSVYTYDHNEKKLYETLDYSFNSAEKRKECEKGTEKGIFSAGCGNVVENGLKKGKNGHIFAMTDNNMLWEIDPVYKSALGTLHYSDSEKLDGFEISGDCIWRICGNKAYCHKFDDINRFMREKDYDKCNFTVSKASLITKTAGANYCDIVNGLKIRALGEKDGLLQFEIY